MSSPKIRRVIHGTDWRILINPSTRYSIDPTIQAQLSQPTWSVSSLAPPTNLTTAAITPPILHHLLRLSALPLPKDEAEEQRMLKTLASQIHFVQEVQKVDTTAVEPLVAIRDETAEARQENTVTLETLRPWLDKEVKVGRNGTVRRQKGKEPAKPLDWDPFGLGQGRDQRRIGRFFFVRKQKEVSVDGGKTKQPSGAV